ncbi:MAG: thiamine biosynthesis protein ThiF [Alteromonadaceae bacterium]|nr:MAG: thiamine biosynthesis protein ThiF [Alteromonadaceae bacterium]
MSDTIFSANEWLRYSRHIQLSSFGADGQIKLKQSRVLMIGSGGLGAPVSLYLAAAGVGHITLVDDDDVDLSNLQRQIIFSVEDIGKSKVFSAKKRLLGLNPEIEIDAINQYFSIELALKLGDNFDLVIDCTDNFSTRYLINDYCLKNRLPWIYASIHQYSGQCALFVPTNKHADNNESNACFRCVFPDAPEDAQDCNSAGVIGVLPGMLGLFQANEALKLLSGLPTPLKNHLMLFDAKHLTLQKITLKASTGCLCQKATINLEQSTAPQVTCASTTADNSLTPDRFNLRRDDDNTAVIDVRSISEHQGFHIGGTHIPLDQLGERADELSPTVTHLCYCQSGKRSEKAVKLLLEKGFKAENLDGGLANWLKHAKDNNQI